MAKVISRDKYGKCFITFNPKSRMPLCLGTIISPLYNTVLKRSYFFIRRVLPVKLHPSPVGHHTFIEMPKGQL
jgi:hypothetical protein